MKIFDIKAKIIFTISLLLIIHNSLEAQSRKRANKNKITYPESTYESIKYRSLGPHRGGRSAAVTGVRGNPNLFYFGATGGGVWKTEDGGQSYENISDGYFGGSIGSVAVSKSDNNVIYVGGGEVTLRGNASSGYGIWKSVDAGKTWNFSGLPKSRHVPRIVIDPNNHNVVYAAVLGNIYKPTSDRGVYKSKDGGKTWEKVLFSNNHSGAVELVMDPSNSRTLYAAILLVYIGFMLLGRLTKFWAMAIYVVVGLIMGWFLLYFGSFLADDASLQTKFGIWGSLINNFIEVDLFNQLFGFGLIEGKYVFSYEFGKSSHALIPQLFGDIGIIGTLIYCSLLFLIFAKVEKGFLYFMAIMLMGSSLFDPWDPVYFAAMGILSAVPNIKKFERNYL